MTQPTQLSFTRVENVATSGLTVGGIYFETSTGIIKVATSATTVEEYGGLVKDATFNKNVLTITKHDGSDDIKLDFNDVASASDVTALLATLRTDIDKNKTDIATLTTKVSTLATGDSVTGLTNRVTTLETTIKGDTTTTGLVTKVANNTTAIDTNAANIASLSSSKADKNGNASNTFSVATPEENEHAANKSYVDTQVSNAISSAYKVKGCLADKAALINIKSPSNGDVYNVSAQVKVTSDEVGSGITKFGDAGTYPAGTNFVWVQHNTSTSQGSDDGHWDALGGTVDLSGYATSENVNNQIAGVESTISGVSKRVSDIEGSYVKDFTSSHTNGTNTDVKNQISVTANNTKGSVTLTIDESELDATIVSIKSDIASIDEKAGVSSFGDKTGEITLDDTNTKWAVKFAMSDNKLTATVNKPDEAGDSTSPIYFDGSAFQTVTTTSTVATANGTAIATEACVKATADEAQSAAVTSAKSYTDGKFVWTSF